MRHHVEGFLWAEEVFGKTITNRDGQIVPVSAVGEQHCMEDVAFIPTLKDWLIHMKNLKLINFFTIDNKKINRLKGG